MNIEYIYKQALDAGNHASALEAVFEAGKNFVPKIDNPVPIVEKAVSLPTIPQTIAGLEPSIDKARELGYKHSLSETNHVNSKR